MPCASAAARMSARSPSSRIQVWWGCSIASAARAVAMTSSTGSLYVVMNTSTVAPAGGGGGSPRSFTRHMVSPKR